MGFISRIAYVYEDILESQTLLDPSISDGEYSVYIRIANLYSPALWKAVTKNVSECVIPLAFHPTDSIYFLGYSGFFTHVVDLFLIFIIQMGCHFSFHLGIPQIY